MFILLIWSLIWIRLVRKNWRINTYINSNLLSYLLWFLNHSIQFSRFSVRSVRQCSVCAARGITIRETIGNVRENLSLHVIDTISEGIYQLLLMYYCTIGVISWSFITLGGSWYATDLENKNCFISIYLSLHLVSSYHAHILETILRN